MSDENEDLSPAVGFFSRRAKLVAKVSPEEIRAATLSLIKNQDKKLENSSGDSFNISSDVENVPFPAGFNLVKKKPATTKRIKKSGIGINNGKELSIDLSPEVTLSAAARRRIQKREKERDLELRLIEEENQKLLSSLKSTEFNEVKEVDVDTFKKIIVLTVTYLSELSRIKCYETDKFSALLPQIAEQFNLKASEFLLSYKEQIIDVNDTPKSLNLSVSDVLECIPYKADENTAAQLQYDTNNLKILFQSNDTKQKIELLVHKLEKMQDIMEKYSQQRDIPLHLLSFEFDGERITGSETPHDLDMESENTIDVRVLGSSEPTSEVINQVTKHTPEKKTQKRTARKTAGRKRTPKKRGRPAKENNEILLVESDADDSDILISD